MAEHQISKPVPPKIPTGVPGLEEVLAGGLQAGRVYPVQGTPRTGKTTLALECPPPRPPLGEAGLYVTLSESPSELNAVAESHGWSLDALDIFELVSEEGLDPDLEQSVLHPSELELGETTRAVMTRVETTRPVRIVFDSL